MQTKNEKTNKTYEQERTPGKTAQKGKKAPTGIATTATKTTTTTTTTTTPRHQPPVQRQQQLAKQQQQPSNNMYIHETEAGRISKASTKQKKSSKSKPKGREKGLRKQLPKPSKTCREIVLFETSPFSFCSKTQAWTKKTPRRKISVFDLPLFFSASSGFVAEPPKPDSYRKIVVSECLFSFFPVVEVIIQKTGTKTGIFQKPISCREKWFEAL